MRRVAWALGLLLTCGAPAAADPELEADPILDAPGFIASAGEYNDSLVAVTKMIVQRLEDANREIASLPPIARFESLRREGLAAFREGGARVETIAERPHDQGFRASVLESIAAAEHIFDVLLPEAFELFSKERVRNADLARLEAIFEEIDETAQRCEERSHEAQRAFAKAAGIRIVPRPDPPQQPPDPSFTAPGIPPVGSALSGDVHVAFAIRYANEVLELQSTLASAANRALDATRGTPADIESAREAELEEVRTERKLAEALEPWQGDASLRDGAVAMARQLEAVLNGPLKTFAHQIGKGIRSQGDADRANALGRDIDAGVRGAFDAFSASERHFRERWAFDAYEAWQKAHPPEPTEGPSPPSGPARPAPPAPRLPDDGPPA